MPIHRYTRKLRFVGWSGTAVIVDIVGHPYTAPGTAAGIEDSKRSTGGSRHPAPAVLPRPVTLQPLALQLADAADGSSTLTGALLAGLLVMTAQLHFAINALALQLLLQGAQRLVDVVVANDDLHKPAGLRSMRNRSSQTWVCAVWEGPIRRNRCFQAEITVQASRPWGLCQGPGEVIDQHLHAQRTQRAERHDEVKPQRSGRPFWQANFQKGRPYFPPYEELGLEREALAGQQHRVEQIRIVGPDPDGRLDHLLAELRMTEAPHARLCAALIGERDVIAQFRR